MYYLNLCCIIPTYSVYRYALYCVGKYYIDVSEDKSMDHGRCII